MPACQQLGIWSDSSPELKFIKFPESMLSLVAPSKEYYGLLLLETTCCRSAAVFSTYTCKLGLIHWSNYHIVLCWKPRATVN